MTIADGGTTVVEIKLSEVDKYTYSVVDNWGNTIVSGEQFEDEAQMAYWSKYAKNDGKWYQASGEEFGMEMNNVDNEWTVNYSTESSISYFFEAENLNKTKDPATEASGVKYSAGKGIGHYSGSTWYSEPLTEGGVYTLAIAGYARRSGGENIGVSIRDAEGNMTETGKSFEYTNEGTEQINKEVEGIEIPAGCSIALVQPNWNSTSYIDYITLTKTADLVQTYTVTIADGIVGGTVVADPTSAKAGDEVTLTNTPAEGYEFVSYSVTGVHEELAVIVTDGKFTMPADDVTVSAEFQKKATPTIYIETDLTAKFNNLATTQWTGSSGQVGWAAPKVKTNSGLEVAAWERYNESCDWTGDIMSSSVTGLAPGTYKIELYGAAAFTYGRGFGSTAFTGDLSKDTSETYKENESIDENTGVTLYAETAEGKVSKEIPIWYATNFNTSGIATATLENVIVGESGEIKIGLSKTSTSTNWHVVQLKGVTAQVPAADVLADAVAAAKSIAESDVPAALYSEIQEAITTYDKEYSTADEYLTAINALNALVDKANGYAPLSAVLNEGAQYKANVPAESPAIAAYDAAIADVKSAYDAAVVADIPAAVKVVEAALPAIAKAQTAPNSDMTRVIVNPTIEGATGWTCEKPKGGNGPLLNGTAFEYWAGNASPRSEGSFDYYQVIEGLPSGKYIISAEMYNSLNGEEGAVFAPTSGVYASSGNDETATLVDVDGTEYIRYATEPVFVKDGTLRLGVKNTEIPMAARWFSADNFTLTLVETIPTYEVDLAEPQNGAIEVSAAVAAEGDKVVITATPNEGYELESVSVKGVKSDIAVQVVTDEVTGEMSFTMPNDAVEVSATFKEIAYPITYAIGMQNGTVEGPVESVAGEKVTLTVTPAEGYELETLTIRGEMSEDIINYDVVDYSFTMPKEGVYIIATFVQSTGIDAASAAKGKKIGVKKYFKNGELIIIGKDGKEFRANGAAK